MTSDRSLGLPGAGYLLPAGVGHISVRLTDDGNPRLRCRECRVRAVIWEERLRPDRRGWATVGEWCPHCGHGYYGRHWDPG